MPITRKLTGSEAVYLDDTRGSTITGSVSTDAADANSAVVISWMIQNKYRGGKPRTGFSVAITGGHSVG